MVRKCLSKDTFSIAQFPVTPRTKKKIGYWANLFITSFEIGHLVTHVVSFATSLARSSHSHKYFSMRGQNGSVIAVKPTKSAVRSCHGKVLNRACSARSSLIHGVTLTKVQALLIPAMGF